MQRVPPDERPASDSRIESVWIRTALAAVCALLVVGSALTGPALAAQNIHDGDATPDSVDEEAKVGHTFTYHVDNVSNDGNTDELFLEFPNSVNASANALSSFSGNVTNAETGESVSISSSPTIVDGPDGDGVEETVRIGVQPSGQPESVDLIVKFTGDVTWPAVDGDTTLGVEGAVVDSKYASAGPSQIVGVSVADTGTSDNTTSDAPDRATMTVALDSTSGPVTEGETVGVDATVTNDGNASGTQTVSLSAGGTQVDSTEVSLDPGESTAVSLSWATESGDAGDRTLSVATANDSASTTVTVEEQSSPSAFFSVSVSSVDSVPVGEPVNATATVTNNGGAADTQSVRFLVDGTRVDSTEVSLDPGQSTSVSLSWPTESGDTGEYDYTLATADASAGGAVTVTERSTPTVRVEAGSVDPDTATADRATSHVFSYTLRNASNDGGSTTLYLTFSNEVNASAGALSSFSGNATDAETGASVSISSSASIVDGPDGDGVEETVRIGVQPEGERTTRTLLVQFTGDVTWPGVDSETDFSVAGAVEDSAYGEDGPTDVATVTVAPADSDETADDGDDVGVTTTVTENGTAANGSDDSDGESGPGFGILAAVCALALALLAARRRVQ